MQIRPVGIPKLVCYVFQRGLKLTRRSCASRTRVTGKLLMDRSFVDHLLLRHRVSVHDRYNLHVSVACDREGTRSISLANETVERNF